MFLQYYPAEYRGTVPPPPPAILELLPKERRIQKKLNRIDKGVSKKAAIDENRRYKRGFMGTMESLCQQAGFQVEKGYNFASTKMVDAFQNWDYEKSTRYFREKFHTLPGETLWDRGYLCSLVSGQMGVPCIVFVTTNYICCQAWTKTREEIQAIIPLKNILSIQKAISLRHAQPSYAPSIRLPEAPSLRCDAIQIYSNDGHVHQLFGFVKEKHYNDLLNILDHAWRAVLTSSSSLLYLNPLAQPGAINQVQGGPVVNPMLAPLSNLPPEPFRPQVISNPYEGATSLPTYPIASTQTAVPMNTPASSLYSSSASMPPSTLYSSSSSAAPLLPIAHPVLSNSVAQFSPATVIVSPGSSQYVPSPRPVPYGASMASGLPPQQLAQPQQQNPFDTSKA